VSVPLWVKISSALAISLGTMAGGGRIMRTIGRKIIDLDPARGFRDLPPQRHVHLARDRIEDVVVLAVTASHQRHDDDAHRLLRVLDAVAQGHRSRGDALRGAEATQRAAILRLTQQRPIIGFIVGYIVMKFVLSLLRKGGPAARRPGGGWEGDDGRPNRQVIRFQMQAPSRAAAGAVGRAPAS